MCLWFLCDWYVFIGKHFPSGPIPQYKMESDTTFNCGLLGSIFIKDVCFGSNCIVCSSISKAESKIRKINAAVNQPFPFGLIAVTVKWLIRTHFESIIWLIKMNIVTIKKVKIEVPDSRIDIALVNCWFVHSSHQLILQYFQNNVHSQHITFK